MSPLGRKAQIRRRALALEHRWSPPSWKSSAPAPLAPLAAAAVEEEVVRVTKVATAILAADSPATAVERVAMPGSRRQLNEHAAQAGTAARCAHGAMATSKSVAAKMPSKVV